MADQSDTTAVRGATDDVDARETRVVNGSAVVANMASEMDAMYYNMCHSKRGLAIILNHENFGIQKLKSRSGTNVDRDNLKESLEHLGFDVKVYNDLPYKNIMKVVEEAVETDHSEHDAFVMAVLSHGEQGILYATDTPYKPEYLWTSFTADKCPSLAGKPKVFFIQACQGDQLDGGITLAKRTEVDGNSVSYKIPTHADFLIAYSTVPGYFSWRNTTYGSWFMQALCFELKRRGREMDMLSLLTFVSQRVAIDFESNCPQNPTMHNQKQIPCVTSMLTRLLKFSRK
ncbi:hypothetical protein R5R35_011083 [Gryllus longicercus]|uniref:Caspase-1 n=1 Tax=Gryllus longicercus TaxID=2509291 RepID=A0AAN9ZCV4_9ORTH